MEIFTAWVTQIFTIHEIGYTVAMAFVAIMVEAWWLRSAKSWFLMYYNGLGFGINVYLRSHIDQDFTMSIVQAHIDNHDYQVDDRILCYFTFPRIGTAVALWPGDFLLFNPQELHSISSCCKSGDNFFTFLLTLKWGLSVSMIMGPRSRPPNNLQSAWCLAELFFRSDLSWSRADLCPNSYVISTRFSLLSSLPSCTHYISNVGIKTGLNSFRNFPYVATFSLRSISVEWV